MSVIGSNIIAGASGTVETGYQISRSLRFNSADSASLTRTPAGAGSRTTWTFSGWLKRAVTGADTFILSANGGNTNDQILNFYINSSDKFVIDSYTNIYRISTRVFRDVGAHMHVHVVWDTNNATAQNRARVWINNEEITVWDTNATISSGQLGGVNGAFAHAIGRREGLNDKFFSGYLSDIRIIDGQALTPSSFGETDANTGVWVPKAYTGTYGTNGFWLKFDDNSGTTSTTLGKDSSGNSNNWTPNNFSVTAGAGNDSLVDSPTNYGTDTGAGGEVRGNYATWNPLAKDDGTTLTNGNLDLSSTNYGNNTATFFLTSGKWYWEGQGTGYVGAICGNSGINWSTSISNAGSNAIGWWEGGPVYWDGGNNGGSTTFTSTDVVGVALDMDAGVVYFYKNGTLTYTITFGSGTVPNLSAGVFPCFNNGISSGTTKSVSTNFGQRAFAYTAPSGFKALCTQNLPTPAIGASASTLASKNFNVVTWTGSNTAAGNSVTGVGFSPDFVWSKPRSVAYQHNLYDVIRGSGKRLISNSTAAEETNAAYGYLSSFDSDGFTTSAGATNNENWNQTSATYVAWNWKANGAGSSNTAGSITSTVSANQTAGISVVTWNGNTAASANVGHGLGVTPAFIISKIRGTTNNWWCYHRSLGTSASIALNLTNASAADTWAVSSSTFTYNFGVTGTYNCVAYCFAEIAGFSRFGNYTGNGSTDGPFVYCGFRPRFVLIKSSSDGTAGNDWAIIDTARNTFNESAKFLRPNLSAAEGDDAGTSPAISIDILSNGFKVRGTSARINTSSSTYIFAAFGESPFNYSRAR